MIHESVTIDEAIAFLNDALNADRKAISDLVLNKRTLCNTNLAAHKTIQVGRVSGTIHPIYEVGILGILNGLFGIEDVTGYGAISALVSYDRKSIDRFERTNFQTIKP